MRVIFTPLPPAVRAVIVDEDTLVLADDLWTLMASRPPVCAAAVLGSLGLVRALELLQALG